MEGEFGLDEVIAPRNLLGPDLLFPFSPLRMLGSSQYTFIPNSVTKSLLVDKETDLDGSGVKVAVLDTGMISWASPFNQFRFKPFSTSLEGFPGDGLGHGCLAGKTSVLTSLCGLRRLEEIWDELPQPATPAKDGEVKVLSEPAYIVSKNGYTKMTAIFRTRANEKTIIRLNNRTLEATTWHIFYVAVPRRAPNGKRRWYMGYDVIEKEAKALKVGDRLCPPLSQTTWTTGIDPVLAYIAGYTAGDGVTLIGYKWKRYRKEIRLFDEDKGQLEGVQELLRGRDCTTHIRQCRPNTWEMDIYGAVVEDIASISIGDVLKDTRALIAWLAGFNDAEGYVDHDSHRCRIRISQANRTLLETLASALRVMGFNCYVLDAGISKGSHCWQ